MRKPCAFPSCKNRSHKEGYCSAHSRQIDAGRELAPLANFASLLPWLEERTQWQSDDCLIWPYSKNKGGYGQVHFRGKQSNAHRAMCFLAHGEPPTSEHEAAHECGNRLCVNPRHLSWKTSGANNMDKLKHGTMPVGERHWNSRLTDGQVRALREFAHTVRDRAVLGSLFGISREATYNILRYNARAA